MSGLTIQSPGQKTSKLVELMRNLAGTRGGTGVGFRRQSGPRKRVTALVASFAAGDTDGVMAAKGAGVDALEIRIAGEKDMRGLADLIARVGMPVGVSMPATADATAAAAAADAGADWVRLPLDASIATMEWEKPGRLLTVPFELELDLAHGLNGLNVEAILIDQAVEMPEEFSYRDALRLGAIRELIKKPLLLHAGPGLPPSAAAASEHLGADALVVYAAGARSTETLAAYIAALEHRATKA
ncbi:MAG: hypothetical protein JWO42_1117 [Chloroflexi bacterium]|nr:hypothetical protein [Chloroflexota bacterium]